MSKTMNQSILCVKHEEVCIHSMGQSYGMRTSVVWFFGNIYVSDAELLQMYTFQIIFRRETVILLPDWTYCDTICDWAEHLFLHRVIWPQQHQCHALITAFHSDLSFQSLNSQTTYPLGSSLSLACSSHTAALGQRSHKDPWAFFLKKVPTLLNNASQCQ